MTQDIDKIEQLVIDTICETPLDFCIKGEQLYLYPVTLGKTYMLGRLLRMLKIDKNLMSVNPMLECYRLAYEQQDICAEIIAIHTCKGKKEVMDAKLMRKRIELLKTLSADELGGILVHVLSDNTTDTLIKHYEIDKELNRLQRIQSSKQDGGNLTFGGKSVYGTLIDAACERYGWHFDYVLWTISYANLRMLMADSIKTVYLSEEERKKMCISTDGVSINMDDDNAFERLMKYNWD